MRFEVRVNEERKSFLLCVILPSLAWFPKYEEMLRILMALRAVEEINKMVRDWIQSSLSPRDLYDDIETVIRRWTVDLRASDFFHPIMRWKK